jgi:hypothetical protein
MRSTWTCKSSGWVVVGCFRRRRKFRSKQFGIILHRIFQEFDSSQNNREFPLKLNSQNRAIET